MEQCGVLVKEEADHGLVMISWTYLHSTLSHFTQIWEAHDETTYYNHHYNRHKHIAFWV